MNDPSTTAQKAFGQSYIYAKLLIKNLDIAVHELKVTQDPLHGKMQFYLEKLNGAVRRAYSGLEKNIGDDLNELEQDIEEFMDRNW
jgi:hypothetical protein